MIKAIHNHSLSDLTRYNSPNLALSKPLRRCHSLALEAGVWRGELTVRTGRNLKEYKQADWCNRLAQK